MLGLELADGAPIRLTVLNGPLVRVPIRVPRMEPFLENWSVGHEDRHSLRDNLSHLGKFIWRIDSRPSFGDMQEEQALAFWGVIALLATFPKAWF